MRKPSDATKLRQLKHEMKLTDEFNAQLIEELGKRRMWGQMMSNLCFNLAQNDHYDPTHRQSMKDCRENWDKITTVRH